MRLTDKQKEELEAVRNLPDDMIDTSDAPEVLDWSKSRRGLLYRLVKQNVTLTLDEYVIDWFESSHPDPQDRQETINRILMEYIRDRKFPNRKGKKEADNPE